MLRFSRVQINALLAMGCLTALAGGGLYIGLVILKDVIPSYQSLDPVFLAAVFAFPTGCALGVIHCAKAFADVDEPNGNGNGHNGNEGNGHGL